MADTEIVERAAAAVERRNDKRIPRWALISIISGMAAVLLSSIGLAANLTIKSIKDEIAATAAFCSSRVDQITVRLEATAANHEGRLAEGERVRAERTKQLDAHEVIMNLNRQRIEAIERGLTGELEQIRKSIDRLTDRVEKLKVPGGS